MILNPPDLAGVAHMAVRALQHQARQTTSSIVTSALSASTTADPTATSSAPSVVTSSATATTSSSSSSNSGGGGGGNNPGSSPLLFFVALGFGVVFTNLWIIVGVKYCFRYNARNRNLRITGEDGEPINLENMPQHPRRRRREKKLMTIDEVNEKFPMMKYKGWVASRAQEGLPTRGGISQPPSRAGSLRNSDAIVAMNKERELNEDRPETAGDSITSSHSHDEAAAQHTEKAAAAADLEGEHKRATDATASGTTQDSHDTAGSDDEHDDEDDHIHDALPPEALESSGDTCAICIDTLEDDDDVRGLTCGHAFHAVCLDPWLTSRRACCPLCKADYYTPKPRPAAADGLQNPEMGPVVSIAQDPRTVRGNMPTRPGAAWSLSGRRNRLGLNGWNRNRQETTQVSTRTSVAQSRRSRATNAPQSQPRRSGNESSAALAEGQPRGLFTNIRMPRFNFPGRSTQSSPHNAAEVTPSNLEAGTPASTAR